MLIRLIRHLLTGQLHGVLDGLRHCIPGPSPWSSSSWINPAPDTLSPSHLLFLFGSSLLDKRRLEASQPSSFPSSTPYHHLPVAAMGTTSKTAASSRKRKQVDDEPTVPDTKSVATSSKKVKRSKNELALATDEKRARRYAQSPHIMMLWPPKSLRLLAGSHPDSVIKHPKHSLSSTNEPQPNAFSSSRVNAHPNLSASKAPERRWNLLARQATSTP